MRKEANTPSALMAAIEATDGCSSVLAGAETLGKYRPLVDPRTPLPLLPSTQRGEYHL